MAYPSTFPGDLDSYIRKTDGIDDVMAVDVNELQSAIEAIETSLAVTVGKVGRLSYWSAEHTMAASRLAESILCGIGLDYTATVYAQLTANRVYTFPNLTGTVALLEAANSFTAAMTLYSTSFTQLANAAAVHALWTWNNTYYVYPFFSLYRARGTQASPTDVAAGDYCGAVNFYARYGGVPTIGIASFNAMIDTFATAYPKGILNFNVNDGSGTGANYNVFQASSVGLKVVGGFGCNGVTPQMAYASGGALAAYGAGANGLDSGANMSALHALVVKIRATLVANGIMS
jgi:hypothetical protein